MYHICFPITSNVLTKELQHISVNSIHALHAPRYKIKNHPVKPCWCCLSINSLRINYLDAGSYIVSNLYTPVHCIPFFPSCKMAPLNDTPCQQTNLTETATNNTQKATENTQRPRSRVMICIQKLNTTPDGGMFGELVGRQKVKLLHVGS